VEYLADTVAIVRHLLHHPALGSKASRVLQETDDGLHRVYLSAISLMEVLYLSEVKRIELPLDELLTYISRTPNYAITPVDSDIVSTAVGIDDVPELHDRIIVATARYLDVPIITADRVITVSRYVESIW